jgi:hypothetical protein
MENKTANRGAREAAIKNLNTIAESVEDRGKIGDPKTRG